MTIRALRQSEERFLKVMQYHALFVPPGEKPFPKAILEEPHISRYLHNWGRHGDLALIVELKGILMGASWCRLFSKDHPGYGFVSENIPEMSIALLPPARNKGIGTKLLQEFIATVRAAGHPGISLSVDQRNPAMRLYLREGFEVVNTVGNPTMLISF